MSKTVFEKPNNGAKGRFLIQIICSQINNFKHLYQIQKKMFIQIYLTRR